MGDSVRRGSFPTDLIASLNICCPSNFDTALWTCPTSRETADSASSSDDSALSSASLSVTALDRFALKNEINRWQILEDKMLRNKHHG